MDLGQLPDDPLHLAGLVRHHVFGQLVLVEAGHFLDGLLLGAQRLADRQHFLDDHRRARQRLHHPELAALDALGDGHLALAGQQGHGAHLAQVHAHRVVRLFQRPRGQVELHLVPARLLGSPLFALGLGGEGRPGHRLLGRLFDDFDPGVVERRKHFVDFVGRMHLGRQQVIDLVVEHVAALFAHGNELPDLVVLFFNRQFFHAPSGDTLG